ncbi:hypothetical protein BYT27DRAFT_7207581 [Phlegmacium glaucopus]|nr:hypothetical protein BYT27DRAFT_7207581 [Phlegmacium glaucopus]
MDLPAPGTKGAPDFNYRFPDELGDFLGEFEDLARQCKLTKQEMSRILGKYVDQAMRTFWKELEGYGKDYRILKEAIWEAHKMMYGTNKKEMSRKEGKRVSMNGQKGKETEDKPTANTMPSPAVLDESTNVPQCSYSDVNDTCANGPSIPMATINELAQENMRMMSEHTIAIENCQPCVSESTDDLVPPSHFSNQSSSPIDDKLAYEDTRMSDERTIVTQDSSSSAHTESVIIAPAINDPAPSCFSTDTVIPNNSNVQPATVNKLAHEGLILSEECTNFAQDLPDSSYSYTKVTAANDSNIQTALVNKLTLEECTTLAQSSYSNNDTAVANIPDPSTTVENKLANDKIHKTTNKRTNFTQDSAATLYRKSIDNELGHEDTQMMDELTFFAQDLSAIPTIVTPTPTKALPPLYSDINVACTGVSDTKAAKDDELEHENRQTMDELTICTLEHQSSMTETSNPTTVTASDDEGNKLEWNRWEEPGKGPDEHEQVTEFEEARVRDDEQAKRKMEGVNKAKEKKETSTYQSLNPRTLEMKIQQVQQQAFYDEIPSNMSLDLKEISNNTDKYFERNMHTGDTSMVKNTNLVHLEPAVLSGKVQKPNMKYLQRQGWIRTSANMYKIQDGTYLFLCYIPWWKGVWLKGIVAMNLGSRDGGEGEIGERDNGKRWLLMMIDKDNKHLSTSSESHDLNTSIASDGNWRFELTGSREGNEDVTIKRNGEMWGSLSGYTRTRQHGHLPYWYCSM